MKYKLYIVLFLTSILSSCAMSTLQTPRTTQQGMYKFNGGAVFTDQFSSPPVNTPILSLGMHYGIFDNFDAGINYFADSALIDFKYSFLPDKPNYPLVSARIGGGYGGYSLSNTIFELIGGYNFQNIIVPYGSVKSINFWQHQINMISPAFGIEYLATSTISLVIEGRSYIKLPGSRSTSDIELPGSRFPSAREVWVKHNYYSINAGVTITFDPEAIFY